jgi:hypothetical protein
MCYWDTQQHQQPFLWAREAALNIRDVGKEARLEAVATKFLAGISPVHWLTCAGGFVNALADSCRCSGQLVQEVSPMHCPEPQGI